MARNFRQGNLWIASYNFWQDKLAPPHRVRVRWFYGKLLRKSSPLILRFLQHIRSDSLLIASKKSVYPVQK